jgi:hypothetical protein
VEPRVSSCHRRVHAGTCADPCFAVVPGFLEYDDDGEEDERYVPLCGVFTDGQTEHNRMLYNIRHAVHSTLCDHSETTTTTKNTTTTAVTTAMPTARRERNGQRRHRNGPVAGAEAGGAPETNSRQNRRDKIRARRLKNTSVYDDSGEPSLDDWNSAEEEQYDDGDDYRRDVERKGNLKSACTTFRARWLMSTWR